MPSVLCEICQKSFSRQGNVNRHKRRVHKISVPINTNIKCLDCKTGEFLSLKLLREHLKNVHGYCIEEEKLEFQTISDFQLWKSKMEQETTTSFKALRGSHENEKKEKVYRYICHRSGTFVSEGSGKRKMRSQESCKIGHYCTAFITAVDTGTKISVSFGNQHYGHDADVEHIRLSQAERTAISSKLQTGVSLQKVLDDVRNSFNGSNLKRIHMLTRKDLNNIKRDFRLIQTEAASSSNVESVKMWVSSKQGGDYNPILLFKPQGERDETGYFKDEDFFLAIMTKAQQTILSKFGSDVICIDSTHGPDSNHFFLISVVVIDDFQTGFPVAFCLSNKQNEHELNKFFTLIKDSVGTVNCKTFMSDDVSPLYSSWNTVMSVPENSLLCTWHVDRAWRKHLEKIKGERLKQNLVYKSLRALMEHDNPDTFSELLNKILQAMFLDTETKDFATYFEATYATRPEKWAFCFRSTADVNINNYIESMYKVIKFVFLEGRSDKRVNKLLDILMKVVRDKVVDRLIKLKKGCTTERIKLVHERHRSSLSISKDSILKTSDETWQVKRSKNDGYYFVTLNAVSCPVTCKLKCLQCRICVHMFTCNCMDNLIYGNLCKHIHAIAQSTEYSSVKSLNKTPDVEDLSLLETLPEVIGHEENDKSTSGYVKIAIEKAQALIIALQENEHMYDNNSAFDMVKKLDRLLAKATRCQKKNQRD